MRPLVAVCLTWGLVCAGLHLAWRVFPVLPAGGFDYISIGVSLYAAAWMTRVYLTRIEPLWGKRRFFRVKWLGGVLAVWLSVYGTAAAGLASNWLAGTQTLVLILLSCMAGAWLAGCLKRPPETVALAVTAGLADMFSIAKGPTKVFSEQIAGYYRGGMEGMPPLVDFIMIKLPMPGQLSFMPVFGATDWVIVAFLSAAAFRFNMTDNLLPGRAYFPVACAGLLAAVVLAREFSLFLPALPFTVAVYLLFMLSRYPAMRRLTRAEILPMIGVSAVLIGLMVFV